MKKDLSDMFIRDGFDIDEVPDAIKKISKSFMFLQDYRYEADYDLARPFDLAKAHQCNWAADVAIAAYDIELKPQLELQPHLMRFHHALLLRHMGKAVQ